MNGGVQEDRDGASQCGQDGKHMLNHKLDAYPSVDHPTSQVSHMRIEIQGTTNSSKPNTSSASNRPNPTFDATK